MGPERDVLMGTNQGTGIHSHSLGFCHSEDAAQHQYECLRYI